MPKVSQCGGVKRNLGECGQPLVNEPLQPAQRRSLVARRIDVPQEFTDRERVCERRSAANMS